MATKTTKNSFLANKEIVKIMFEYAEDGIVIVDLNTKKFILGNPEICKISGYTAKEISNMYVRDFHPQEHINQTMEQFSLAEKGKVRFHKSIPILHKDKRTIYCDISSSKIEQQGRKYLIGIFKNITERF